MYKLTLLTAILTTTISCAQLVPGTIRTESQINNSEHTIKHEIGISLETLEIFKDACKLEAQAANVPIELQEEYISACASDKTAELLEALSNLATDAAELQ